MKVYEVVGWRKEYYIRCERELIERGQRVAEFLKEKFGIEREDIKTYDINSPSVRIREPHKYYEFLARRKDIKVEREGYNPFRGKYLYAVITPYRKTKEGKKLYEEWKEVLEGDFGVFNPTIPFFLKLSWLNISDEDRKHVNLEGGVSAVVREEGDRLFLVDWENFDPDKLEGFKPIEVDAGVR